MSDSTSIWPTCVYAADFSYWKRAAVRHFFAPSRVIFITHAKQVPRGSTLALWGRKPIKGPLDTSVKILRLEDGFLRSVGLGADLIRPISWVIDQRGIYYDATQPSDLEYLLLHTDFTPDLLARAAKLRARISAEGLTKYNVGHRAWQRPAHAQRVILVPGQVESDASLKYGAPGIRANMDLLQSVRSANPDAYILYKPHPDVVAGLRAQGQNEDQSLAWCDEQLTDVSMGQLLPLVDEVHLLTSLTGFEALLRGKKVTCYGQPFYAGWGLTQDQLPPHRRGRSLSLDALVAGVLILYPRYSSLVDGAPITPEVALDELRTWRDKQGSKLPWWRKVFRMILRMAVGVR